MESIARDRVYSKTKLLYSERQVTEAVDRLAVRLTARLAESEPLVLCMMNGGLMFTAAIMRRLHIPLQFDYIHLTRYRDSERGGQIEWHKRPNESVRDRTVLLIDDICDHGTSLLEAVKSVKSAGAREIVTAVLIRRINPDACFMPDFVALECKSGFVLGWGMDFGGYGRNLSAIHLLNEEGQ